jgi:cytochrome P450
MKNVTLAMDEDLLLRGREYARAHKVSFNDWVRGLIERTVKRNSKQWIEDTLKLMNEAHGNSRGKKWTRAEIQRYG